MAPLNPILVLLTSLAAAAWPMVSAAAPVAALDLPDIARCMPAHGGTGMGTKLVLETVKGKTLVTEVYGMVSVNDDGSYVYLQPDLIHELRGEVTLCRYRFISDAKRPLVFVTDRVRGYVFRQGRGTVVPPTGPRIELDRP